ncbi:3-dehydroquinate dehydratase [Thermodesulfobium narugense DSM 14796]|uniref:3-dehydroquinate dehydratase n=1 Tax=Thermodesulfobium narugense DSM 14796 TaxID=747365 RepID=M1E6S9_9BACT|nr:type II 3-dehydroquinate dehydratase [Thermodesulfobium narugense]AEE14956.1 3-dehydroquinate dehydratase [Thermodesulfobium narugense DSM 14796]
MKKILVINGPNLNMLGTREPNIYGSITLHGLEELILNFAKELEMKVDFFQSNHEGDIIDKIHRTFDAYDAFIINPGAFTHYSYAIRDAIASITIPVIEVHLSNVHAREEFRKSSVIAPVCLGQISGLGELSYIAAIVALDKYLQKLEKRA